MKPPVPTAGRFSSLGSLSSDWIASGSAISRRIRIGLCGCGGLPQLSSEGIRRTISQRSRPRARTFQVSAARRMGVRCGRTGNHVCQPRRSGQLSGTWQKLVSEAKWNGSHAGPSERRGSSLSHLRSIGRRIALLCLSFHRRDQRKGRRHHCSARIGCSMRGLPRTGRGPRPRPAACSREKSRKALSVGVERFLRRLPPHARACRQCHGFAKSLERAASTADARSQRLFPQE